MKKILVISMIVLLLFIVAVAIYHCQKVDYSGDILNLVGTWELKDKTESISFSNTNGELRGSRTKVVSSEKMIENFKWKLSRGHITLYFWDSNGEKKHKEKYSIGLTEHYLVLMDDMRELKYERV